MIPVADEIYVCNWSGDSIAVHPRTASGDVAPIRQIFGTNTGINGCEGVAFDVEARELYVFDATSITIRVFSAEADGDVEPIRIMSGLSDLTDPYGGAIDYARGEVIVVGKFDIMTFPLGASGDVEPTRTITPGFLTDSHKEVAYDPDREEIFVVDDEGERVLVYDRLDDGEVAPKRTIEGLNTDFAQPTAITLIR